MVFDLFMTSFGTRFILLAIKLLIGYRWKFLINQSLENAHVIAKVLLKLKSHVFRTRLFDIRDIFFNTSMEKVRVFFFFLSIL